ncbi:MAG TPA: hypothetical protein VGD65_25690 [Chryseosolibacter sp.]
MKNPLPKLLLVIIVFSFSNTTYAQQWTGASDASGNIQHIGNVGIGTNAAPGYKLSVQGEIHVNRDYPYVQFNSSYWNAGSFIQNGVTTAGNGGGDYFVFYNPAGKGFNFYQAGYDVLTLTPNRLVGINTSNPAGRLDINGVNGQLRLSGGSISAGVWTSASDMLYLANWNDGRKGIQVNMATGNIGIGTYTLDTRLTVNGKIKAEEVEIVVDVPADYVFDENYHRLSLYEVEKYVRENRHLPNIPSAEELKESGWQVGEMSNKLLEKVEELTLYLIELKNQSDAQQKLIEEQQSRILELESKLRSQK